MNDASGEADVLGGRGARAVVGGVALRPGHRVRLRPSHRADIVDLALSGKLAEVDRVEEGVDGRIHVVVTIEGDAALDLGPMSQIGHRFFFAPDELELVEGGEQYGGARVLVAGFGDSFGPGGGFVRAVVDRLRGRLPRGVHTADFGIRSGDLFAALAEFDAAVLVCSARRGGAAGTVSVLESEPDGWTHMLGVGLGWSEFPRGSRCRRGFAVLHEPGSGAGREPEPVVIEDAVWIIESIVDDVVVLGMCDESGEPR